MRRHTDNLKLKLYPLVACLVAVWLWALTADRQARVNVGEPATGESQQAEGKPVVSASFHGLTAKGDYYSCVRPAEIRPHHPAYKRLLEACVVIPLPDTGER